MSGAVRAFLATLAVVVAFGLFLWARQPSLPAVAAPDFILPNLAGETIRLQDLRGKVVLLNVWATWCPPCVEEMPTLETLSARMKGRDFVLLAVSQDERPKVVKPWIEERGFTFPVLLDPRGQVGHEYGVTGYPETFVIDRRGRIVHHHVGFRDWAEAEIVAALETLLTTGEWRGEGESASGTPATDLNGG